MAPSTGAHFCNYLLLLELTSRANNFKEIPKKQLLSSKEILYFTILYKLDKSQHVHTVLHVMKTL